MANIASEIVRSEPIKRARKARKGDIVVVDFVGSVGGEEFDGGKAEDFPADTWFEQLYRRVSRIS